MEVVETEFEKLRLEKAVSSPFEFLILFMRHSTASCFLPLLVAASIAASRCRFWLPFCRSKSSRSIISSDQTGVAGCGFPLRPHKSGHTKKSAANYTNRTLVRSLTANPNAVRVGTHVRSCPDWGSHKGSCPDQKHQPTARNVSPGPERSEGPA